MGLPDLGLEVEDDDFGAFPLDEDDLVGSFDWEDFLWWDEVECCFVFSSLPDESGK